MPDTTLLPGEAATLGRIAHEAGEKAGKWQRRWTDLGKNQRAEWEEIARAVALADRAQRAAGVPDHFGDANKMVPDDVIEDYAIELFTTAGGSSPLADKLERIDAVLRRLLALAASPAAPASQTAPDCDYPECSGDPNCCPENEGYGCCGRAVPSDLGGSHE